MELKELFSEQRIYGGGSAVLVAIYAPVGLFLFFIRIFIGLHVFLISSLLPKFSVFRRVVLRVMYGILGLAVTSKGNGNRDNDVNIIVANHISIFDHVALNLILPCAVPNVWNFPKFLCWMLGYQDMGASQGRQSLVNNVKQYKDKHPVLAFPEGAMTNGKVGLLKFSTWPFSVEDAVQPICISASRPMLSASLCYISSSLWMDMLWFLFVPCTLFHIKILPVMKKQESQTAEEFAQQVQETIAKELSVEATKFTSQDKSEYLKRKRIDTNLVTTSSSATTEAVITTPPTPPPSPTQKEPPKFDFRKSWSEKELNEEIEIMVRQVKGVLFDTDESVIRKDLEQTNSVDATITNIVEGKTTQDATEEPATESDIKTDVKVSASSLKFADSQFGKTSKDRQKSLEERKLALLASAKRHFEASEDKPE
ncbi:lipid droplet-regulating VLDL assembly factor AUP1-like isoform X2 [Apostichopus japonicus]|uniref:lipid droplet-regulating VLDL assembly factor AUP1-like isoform X2 n=1 Tax=Stichopus japonicus TaxID=307972 RepID=UPI003AB236F3